jgi:hypothetical protein
MNKPTIVKPPAQGKSNLTKFEFKCTQCTNGVTFDVAAFEYQVRKTRPHPTAKGVLEVGLLCPFCGAWHILFYSKFSIEEKRKQALNEHRPGHRMKARIQYERALDKWNAEMKPLLEPVLEPHE